MVINGIPFTVELYEILEELQMQLHLNGINLLSKIKDTDDNVMISCPYHKNGQERKPSAGIRKSDGQFHCFTCGEVHTLPEMISFCFGHPDDMVGAKGWQWLTQNFLTVELEERKPIKLDCDRHKSILAPLNYVSEEELESYRYYHPYMFKRKIMAEFEAWKNSSGRKKALVVKGLRQIGKTYSVREFAKANYENIVYVNFKENERAKKIFDADLNVN